MFMEEMTRKQPDVDKVTKTYKRKPAEAPSSLAERRGARESPCSPSGQPTRFLTRCQKLKFVSSTGKHQQPQQQQHAAMQVAGGNPRLNQLCARWQQVWLLALDRQRKLNDGLDRLEEVTGLDRGVGTSTVTFFLPLNCLLWIVHPQLKEFANFDFDVWRKKYMRWMNHKKSRVMDFFRRIDKDQDGKITRQEFIDGILASSRLRAMTVFTL